MKAALLAEYHRHLELVDRPVPALGRLRDGDITGRAVLVP